MAMSSHNQNITSFVIYHVNPLILIGESFLQSQPKPKPIKKTRKFWQRHVFLLCRLACLDSHGDQQRRCQVQRMLRGRERMDLGEWLGDY